MTPYVRSALVVALSLMATGCGKKGPLIYPDMLAPAAPSGVSARQSGTAVKLQFVLPDKDRGGRSMQGLAGVKIGRRVTESGQGDVCRSCMTDYILFRTLYLGHAEANTQRFGDRLVLLDSDVSAGNVYSYRLVPFTDDGVEGASAPPTDVRMDSPLAAPVVKAESFPTEVKIHFSSASQMPGRLLGFNLYRTSGTAPHSYLPLNREPLKGDVYSDGALERGVKYRYTARALVAMPPAGDVAESLESQEAEGILKDDE